MTERNFLEAAPVFAIMSFVTVYMTWDFWRRIGKRIACFFLEHQFQFEGDTWAEPRPWPSAVIAIMQKRCCQRCGVTQDVFIHSGSYEDLLK